MMISLDPQGKLMESRRPRRARGLLSGMVMLVVLVVLVAFVGFFRSAASSALWRVLAPVLSARAALSSSQVAQLRAELASSTAALADRDVLYRENLDLKARLGRQDAAPGRVLAAVLERPPSAPYDTLMIDAGTAQGVEVDDLVSAGGSALVGKVSEAYPSSARVVLFSAPSEGYQALLYAKDSRQGAVPLSVEGMGGGSMIALAPAGTRVAAGDKVVFSGIAGGLAGEVSAADAKENESFVTIYLHLPVNIFELQYVEVWKNK